MKKSSIILVVLSAVLFIAAFSFTLLGVKKYIDSTKSTKNNNDRITSTKSDSDKESVSEDNYKKSYNNFTLKVSGLESNSEWLCEFSGTRLINDDDMSAIIGGNTQSMPDNKPISQMIINEMYARHGYAFKTDSIQAYFDNKEWYRNIGTRISDMDQIYRGMNEIEKKNIDYLQQYND